MATVAVELGGFVKLLTMPAKLGMLANELTIFSKLTRSAFAVVTFTFTLFAVALVASLAGCATSLAAPAKLGM